MEGQENKNSVSEISKKLDGIQQGLETSVKDIKENLVNQTKSIVDSEIKKINESVETQFKKINESNDKFQNTVEEFVNNTKSYTQKESSGLSEVEKKEFAEVIKTEVDLLNPVSIKTDSGKFFKKGKFKAFINTSDNSHAGLFFNGETQIGNIIEKLATVNPIIDLVRNFSTNQVIGGLAFNLIDKSAPNSVNGKLANEGGTAKEMKKSKGKKVRFYLGKYIAKDYITAEAYEALQQGQYDFDWLLSEFAAIEENDRKEISASIMNGVLQAETQGIKGIIPAIQQTTSANSNFQRYLSAAQGVFTFNDFDKFIQKFKVGYTLNPGFACLMDKGVLASMFITEGTDGHQKTERFVYADDGLMKIKTAQGLIRIIPVDTNTDANKVDENDGFAKYNLFNDDFTAQNNPATTGFVGSAGPDSGKLACVAGLFNEAYTLATSTVVKTGVASSFKDELEDGEFVMGKVSYRAGNVTKEEALGIAVLKN